ncbi:MAG: iron ABC transporter permease [Thermoplasmatales archaeon]|nr:iron ABC transporter permease [Thermoplasmatales archaeon]
MVEDYHASIARKILVLSTSIVVLIVLIILSCAWGTDNSFGTAYKAIIDHIMGKTYPIRSWEWWQDHYIWQNVMPSIVVSIIAGAGLAVGGMVMQAITHNPLADPYTTGISSGACLGAVIAILIGFTFASTAGEYGILSNAFIFSLIPALLVVTISRRVGNSPSTIILIGIAVSYFFGGMITFLMMMSDPIKMYEAYRWQIGSVTGIKWGDIPFMATAVIITSIITYSMTSKLDLMMLGDDSAKSLGLNAEQFRTVCLVMLSVLIASIISYTGIIGFVGLMVPHIARFLVGGKSFFVLPTSMVIGSAVLVFANMVSHTITFYTEVPVGIVMSFIGAPFFLYLILRKKSQRQIF